MTSKVNRWLAMFLTLVMCLTMLPGAALAAHKSDGTSVTELGTGGYAVTLKNDCEAAVPYSVTLDGETTEVTLNGYESLTLKGEVGETYTVTCGAGDGMTVSGQATKSGTFGADPVQYDGFDGYDGNTYTTNEVSNAPLTGVTRFIEYSHPVEFYYVDLNVLEGYSETSVFFITNYYYENVSVNPTEIVGSGAKRSSARSDALKNMGIIEGDEDRYFQVSDDDIAVWCIWTFYKATPYISFTVSVENYTLTLVNDCDAPVKYDVTIGQDTQTITLDAGEEQEFTAAPGTSYSITWIGGTDGDYSYVEPVVKEYTGVFGQNIETVYYVDGEEYTGEVSDTLSYNNYNMSAGTLYAVDTLKTFTRNKNTFGYTYTNINNSGEFYSATSASGARDNIMKSHPGYTLIADGSDLGYAWVFKPVTTDTKTSAGDTTITFTATAVESNYTGTFKVAALNVDGMPQSVKIANVYDLKLNEDGPGAAGSTSIGAYIEDSGIDLLGLSENFNFFQEINAAAPSYATMTQRERIPTEVGLGDLNNSLFPFDTDGLNLMYKEGLTVSSESITVWNEHYSPTTFYGVGSIGIDVPDKNGADGMIDKGFRFYQVQMAPGVVVDVYILHMDAETDPGDNAARESQLEQLAAAIEANDNGNPVIVMGDTNCRYTRDPLEEIMIKQLGMTDPWIELERGGIYPQVGDSSIMVGDVGYQKGEVVDKVFYKNASDSNVQIEATKYFVDADGYTDDGGLLGDHPPVIVTFIYSFTPNALEHEHDWSEDWSSDAGYHWHECAAEGCSVSMNSQKDGYDKHSFTETITEQPTCTETGTKTLTCSVCNYQTMEVIPNIGHQWDEGTITTQPTATTDGVKTYTCTACEATYEETIPATGVQRDYTFEVKLDKEDYNVGDTVTADIYIKSDDADANFGAISFELALSETLTFQNMTSALAGGSVSIEGSKYGYNVNSDTSISVTSEGVKLATATFKVNNTVTADSQAVALGLTLAEVTEIDQNTPSASTFQSATATLHNIKATLNPGDHATIGGEKDAVTLYAKYNESGLWSDENRTAVAAAPTLSADSGYRLADNEWSGDMTDFAAIAAQTFTASQTYTVQTVKIWNVTFVAGEHVKFADGAETAVVVDDGTQFSAVSKPSYTVDEHYTFDGWFNGNVAMTDDSTITGDLTLTAKASAKEFSFTQEADNAKIENLTGVTNGKVAYGTDVTFTVNPDSSYVISSVSYTVGDSTAIPLTAQDDTYTISGSAITDDITVEVTATKYHTVQFVAGEGVNMTTAAAYVKDGQAALYTSTSFDTRFTIPTPAAEAGYRLAADTAAEPLWSDGTNKYQTSALGSSVVFTADATLTAQAVKQWTVTFMSGEHGSFAQDVQNEIVVDEGTVLTEAQIPTVRVEPGYAFTGWDKNIADAITADTTFIAQYQDAAYTLTLPEVDGISFAVEGAAQGDGTYTVTHGTDVSITMTAESDVNVTGLSYQIGDGEPIAVNDFTAPFTILGDNIIGNITVTVESVHTYQITVTVDGGNGTVNGKTSDTVTFAYNTSAEDAAKAFTFAADPGYQAVPPTFETVTANKTYTVIFTHASYSVTWPDGSQTTATHGTDLTFTPALDGQLLLGVQYQVNDGEAIALQPDQNGSYTIPGDAIVGPIKVTYMTLTGSLEYIAETDYVAAPSGKKIAVLNTVKLEQGTYALNGYGDMFWSDKYNAYVCFVSNDETDETLLAKLAVSQNAVTVIDYSGDINDTGTVTAGDSAPINAVLHDINVAYEISDLMRFRFDVTGDKKVSTQDIMWILNTYTGAPQSN